MLGVGGGDGVTRFGRVADSLYERLDESTAGSAQVEVV